ncbi:MAG: hypothetical protein WCE48_12125, partial [Steroidobacteraceae bacterium]
MRVDRFRPISVWAALLLVLVGVLVAFDVSQSRGLLAASTAAQEISRTRITLVQLANELRGLRDTAAADATVERRIAELRRLVAEVDANIGDLIRYAAADDPGDVWRHTHPRDPAALRLHRQIRGDWSQYRMRLEPIIAAGAVSGDPYGRATSEQLAAAATSGATSGLELDHGLDSLMRGIALEAQGRSEFGWNVRLGVLAAALLMIGIVVFRNLRQLRRDDADQAATLTQLRCVLDNAAEGFILIDRKYLIDRSVSGTAVRLFRREALAGESFAELLEQCLPEQARHAALSHLSLLWNAGAADALVATLNPIAETEVRLPAASGGFEARQFAFDFVRVRTDGLTTHALCSVADVTDRVTRAREIATAQTSGTPTLAPLLSVMQLKPSQVTAFVANTGAALARVNSVLKAPVRDATGLREKLERIERETQALQTDAPALGAPFVAETALQFAALLTGLRAQPALSGRDFLPLTLKLLELLDQIAALRDIVSRLNHFRAAVLESSPAVKPLVRAAAAPAPAGALH